jgi:hypothetical protein
MTSLSWCQAASGAQDQVFVTVRELRVDSCSEPCLMGGCVCCLQLLLAFMSTVIYRMIQEELPPLTELISDDILSRKCHVNLGPIHSIYRSAFVFGNTLL